VEAKALKEKLMQQKAVGWLIGISLALATGWGWAVEPLGRSPPQAAPPPEMTIAACAKAPALDGDLSDPCWAKAAELKLASTLESSDTSLDTKAAARAWATL